MTADSYLVIRCDGTDPSECDNRCGAEGTWPIRVWTHAELRRLLRTERGWSRRYRPSRDLCPDCTSREPSAGG
ncbi:hypothetical protein [Streptomyces sp. CAU 1734]|uniref:hypothetical protein n=1 Tax=Streptomyces sp. CAU 1734 TaxID=3140360 RepID=UPI0032606B5A